MTYYIDNQRPTMSKRDKEVELRNNVLGIIMNGCEHLTNGNRGFLAHTLKTINNDHRGRYAEFTVDTKPEKTYNFFHADYTAEDGIVVIKEGNDELIVILQLKEGQCKGEWRAYELSHYEFQYDEELEAEAKWEQDADNAYEKHLDYLASFDDPRGY
jgi:hypothetical protein